MRTQPSRLPVRSLFPVRLSSLLLVLAVGSPTLGAVQTKVFNVPVSTDDGFAGDLFACALALSHERTLVVGSVLDDDLGTDSGSLYVFRRRGGVFERTAKLVASDGAAEHRLGFSVAIDPTGARLAAGAIFHDAAGQNAGAAYVFRREGGGWEQEARLIPTGADGVGPFDQLGHSIALDRDVLAVGAPGDDTRADAAGAVYVFERGEPGVGPGDWALAAKLVASPGGQTVGDGLGFAVALDGDTLLAGAPFADDGLGAVHVFVRGPGGWQEVQRITAPERRAGALFGAAVALDGDRAVVGARLDNGTRLKDGEEGRTGAAWVFRRVAGVWELETRLPAPEGLAEGDELGISVALDGNALAVGARFDDEGTDDEKAIDENTDDSGAVYRYRFQGGEWRLVEKLKAPGAGVGDELGFAVAVEDQHLEQDDLVIAGAYRTNTEAGEDAGIAWLRVEARNADMAVTKSDNRVGAAVGDRVIYTLRATNRGPADVAGARVTDTFPAGLFGCSWSCTPDGTGATCDTPPPAAGATVTELDALVSLPAGTSADFRVTCTVAGGAQCTTIRNRVRIDPPDDVLEVDDTDNTATDVTRIGSSLLTVAKQAPDTVTAGGTLTETIAVTNVGPCPAVPVRVTDVFPEEGFPGGDPRIGCSWRCAGVACGAPAGAGNVEDTLPSLPSSFPGSQVVYTTTCTVPASVPDGTLLCDTATAVGPSNAPAATACTRVVKPSVEPPDLRVRLEAADPEIVAGGTFTVRATVDNVGAGGAENVTLTLLLDPPLPSVSLESVTVTPSGSCDAELGCSLPDLAPGGTAVVEAVFRTEPTGCDTLDPLDLEISARAASVPADLNPTNNQDGAGVRVIPTAVTDCPVDLRLVKRVVSQIAGLVTFSVDVSNAGPETAFNARVEDLIPDGLQATTALWTCEPSDGATCNAGTGDLVDLVTLPPGATATYTLTAQVSFGACGTFTNFARVQAMSPNIESKPNDNFDSVSFLALPSSGTCASKSVSPKVQMVGGQVTYTIEIVHAGPGVFGGPGPELEDLFPAELIVVSASADRGTATFLGNLVTWDGTLQPGESVIVTVVATVDVADPGTEICNQGTLLPSMTPTDDPDEPGLTDPTCFRVVLSVPTLSPLLLALMAMLLLALGLRRLRRS